MLRKPLTIVATGLAVLLTTGAARAATLIGFEEWSGGYGSPIISGGCVFEGSLFVAVEPTSNNATNALWSLGASFKMIEMDYNAFDVLSVDLQEGIGNTTSIRLVGSFPFPGGQVVETFELDGDLSTYETFCPSSFAGVVGVHFYALTGQGQTSTGGFSVDNIVVPEPGAFVLALFVLVAVGEKRPPNAWWGIGLLRHSWSLE